MKRLHCAKKCSLIQYCHYCIGIQICKIQHFWNVDAIQALLFDSFNVCSCQYFIKICNLLYHLILSCLQFDMHNGSTYHPTIFLLHIPLLSSSQPRGGRPKTWYRRRRKKDLKSLSTALCTIDLSIYIQVQGGLTQNPLNRSHLFLLLRLIFIAKQTIIITRSLGLSVCLQSKIIKRQQNHY